MSELGLSRSIDRLTMGVIQDLDLVFYLGNHHVQVDVISCIMGFYKWWGIGSYRVSLSWFGRW